MSAAIQPLNINKTQFMGLSTTGLVAKSAACLMVNAAQKASSLSPGPLFCSGAVAADAGGQREGTRPASGERQPEAHQPALQRLRSYRPRQPPEPGVVPLPAVRAQ
jgi:hypothetical protein